MLLIKNCKVLAGNEFLERSILIGDDGKIEKVATSGLKTADVVVDAAGKYALPGLIDIHVHFREPGMTQKEDFLTGSRAAAAGGVTTIFDMPNTRPATTTVQLLEEKRKLAAAKCVVNYGLYMGATATNLEEVEKARNIPGVKLYMGSTTGDMAMTDKEKIRDFFHSGRKIVVHAEDEELMKRNMENFKGENNSEIHAKIRSGEVALAAVKEAISIGGDIHITHSSTKEEMKMIKAKGITCDVTPHHLFLTADELKKQGNYAKMNPPLRSREDVEALWMAVNDGTVNCIATDHAPHTAEEKEKGYREAPSGVPGVQTMLSLLLDAVNKKRLTLQQLIRLTSENPASLFSIKNKGKLAVAADADITLVDLKEEKTIKNDDMLSKCGWTPFNGWKVKGAVAATIVNGTVVYDEGAIMNEKTKGKEAIFNGK